MKAAQWVEDNSYETAQIQIEKEYVAGDVDFNFELLDSYNYKPSIQGGYDALRYFVTDLKEIGILKEETDAEALIENSFISYE